MSDLKPKLCVTRSKDAILFTLAIINAPFDVLNQEILEEVPETCTETLENISVEISADRYSGQL